MRNLLLLTSSVLALCKFCESCGISVHNEVTHRSLDLLRPSSAMESEYKNILLQSKSYIQAGSFFPDWGYQCLGYNQQAEDGESALNLEIDQTCNNQNGLYLFEAHWAPFIRAAIDHIRENYPSARLSNDPHVQGLISFVYAVMSHDVADVRWHSLQGLTGYFIQTMAHLNFRGSYNEAHTAADAGGEFTLQHFSHLLYQNATWKIPLRDVIAIYTRLYKDNNQSTPIPDEEHLKFCVTTAFAASKMNHRFGKFLFGYYGRQSPFLVEQVVDFHKGGLQDMAASVAECSTDIFNALEYGHQGIRLCGRYFDDSSYDASLRKRVWRPDPVQKPPEEEHWKDFMEQLYDSTTGILSLRITNETFIQELPFDPPADMPDIVSHQQGQPYLSYQGIDNIPRTQSPECIQLHSRQPLFNDDNAPSSITMSLPASSVAIGHTTAVGDFNGDGDMDLAISAPYHDGTRSNDLMNGIVLILNNTGNMLSDNDGSTLFDDIRKRSWMTLEGHIAHGRFGWSMANVDLNQDGIDDLAVAAPFATDSGGYVDIYFGRKGQQLDTTPNLRVQISMENTEGFGSFITGLDVDNDGYKDLIIGCPYCPYADMEQAGTVYGILSSRHHALEDNFLISRPDFKILSTVFQSYEHFGASIELVRDDMGRTTLLIGAPGYRTTSLQSVGRIYAFEIGRFGLPALAWVMQGTKEFQQFGSVITAGKGTNTVGLVAISSPSEETQKGLKKHWQAGVVRQYDWKLLSNCNKGSSTRSIHCGLVKELRGQQTTGHLGKAMAFFDNSQQDYGLWVGEPLALREKGRVYKWSLAEDGLSCVNDEAGMARFGSHIQPLGDNALGISSQLYSHDSRFSGAIHLVQTDFA